MLISQRELSPAGAAGAVGAAAGVVCAAAEKKQARHKNTVHSKSFRATPSFCINILIDRFYH
jgi:hypothetical protein